MQKVHLSFSFARDSECTLRVLAFPPRNDVIYDIMMIYDNDVDLCRKIFSYYALRKSI